MTVTTVPVREDYQMIHWPESIKCSKETIVSSPKALRMALFSLVLRKISIDLYWAYGGPVAVVTRQAGAAQREKDVPQFNQIQGTHLFFFFFCESKPTKILLKAKSVLCLGAEREGPTNFGQKQEEARGLEVTSCS